MIEQDNELRKVLRKWESPVPPASLDDRVWTAIRQTSQPSKLAKPSQKRYRIAAAVVLGGALIWHLSQGRAPDNTPRQNVSIESRTTAVGFMPLPDGAITVVKVETNQ